MLNWWFNSASVRLIGKRILQSIPVVWGVTFLTFLILNLLPGGAATAILGMNATPSAVKALNARLGFDQPLFVRYGQWLRSAITGHFGNSLTSSQAVTTILAQRLPVTLELGLLSFSVGLILAVAVALLAARKPRGVFDRVNLGVSMVGLSIPGFVSALVLILVFADKLRWVPAVGFTPLSDGVWKNLRGMILPVATLSIGIAAIYARLLRSDLVDQLVGEDYITTARAKGISPWKILVAHAFRNALFGLLTLVGLNIGTLVGGSVLIEQIFALPGIGQEIFIAVSNRDSPVVEGVVAMTAVAVVVGNLGADLLYAILDPRIRYGRSTS